MSPGVCLEQQEAESLLPEGAEGWRGSRGGRLGQEPRFVSVAFAMAIQGDTQSRRQGASLDFRSKVWINLGIVPSKEEGHETESRLEGMGVCLGEPCFRPPPGLVPFSLHPGCARPPQAPRVGGSDAPVNDSPLPGAQHCGVTWYWVLAPGSLSVSGELGPPVI